jgi:hypothetical protein
MPCGAHSMRNFKFCESKVKREQGYTDEQAKRVCGKIKSETSKATDMFGEQEPCGDWMSTAKPGTSPLSKSINALNSGTEIVKGLRNKRPSDWDLSDSGRAAATNRVAGDMPHLGRERRQSNKDAELEKSIRVKKPVLRPSRYMTQAGAAIGSISQQERQKSKHPVRKAIEAVNELTKAIMRIPLTKKPDPKKPATREARPGDKRVGKAMTAGTSASTGSFLMHAVADGATVKRNVTPKEAARLATSKENTREHPEYYSDKKR